MSYTNRNFERFAEFFYIIFDWNNKRCIKRSINKIGSHRLYKKSVVCRVVTGRQRPPVLRVIIFCSIHLILCSIHLASRHYFKKKASQTAFDEEYFRRCIGIPHSLHMLYVYVTIMHIVWSMHAKASCAASMLHVSYETTYPRSLSRSQY